MKSFRVLLAVLSLVLIAACTGGGGGGGGGAVTTTTTAAPPAWQTEMLNSINAERAANGVSPPLTLCRNLNTAAQGHSNWQAANLTMSHTGSGGSTPSQRVTAAGYTGWNAVGENVAYGQTSVSQVMTAWMNSPGHRANILSTNFSNVGFGMATASNGQLYWTQNFGRGGVCG